MKLFLILVVAFLSLVSGVPVKPHGADQSSLEADSTSQTKNHQISSPVDKHTESLNAACRPANINQSCLQSAYNAVIELIRLEKAYRDLIYTADSNSPTQKKEMGKRNELTHKIEKIADAAADAVAGASTGRLEQLFMLIELQSNLLQLERSLSQGKLQDLNRRWLWLVAGLAMLLLVRGTVAKWLSRWNMQSMVKGCGMLASDSETQNKKVEREEKLKEVKIQERGNITFEHDVFSRTTNGVA
ncbi:hypothetical protein CLAFUR4_14469 [Fulvia fulva]|nr:hypothetical protein CLAFUR4_14469 [Fulvia fulva]KAK4609891.1 hypothetical protein CLAFUR0_14471 [Fulvia fulva]WPV37413.1 hypothetical protein CLAFUW7_14478 [Fulvia fulva]